MMKRTFLTLFTIILVVTGTFSQSFKKALEKPQSFLKPIDNDAFYLTSTSPKLASTPWVVMGDRSEPELTQTYQKPDPNSGKMKNIEYLETYFVVDEDKEWIHIVKGRLKSGVQFYDGTVQDFGWINKKNVLLWTNSLRDSRTGIHLKAFLLNKASDVKNVLKEKNKDIANIFKGPETATTVGEKKIYEFYFVLKKENDRYLLCKNENTGEGLTDEVIGWVERRRATDWNTRMAFEPNFTQDAFKERSVNKALRVFGFSDQESANKFSESGNPDFGSVVWANDPAGLATTQLAQSDSKRFKGAVVRFPMLTNNEKSFRSGVIGDINTVNTNGIQSKMDEVSYSGLDRNNQLKENAQKKYNIFIAMEGTNSTAPFSNTIVEVINKIKKDFSDVASLKIGGLLYRDVPEKQNNKLLEIKKLTTNTDEIINFFKNAEYGRWFDNDEYTALNYGLYQGLLEAGFDKENTNIVIVIGNYADYIQNKIRRTDAENSKEPTLTKRELIENLLAEIGAHILYIQCKSEDSEANEKYIRQGRSFILESAKIQFDDYKNISAKIPDIKFGVPDIPDVDESNDIRIKNGPSMGRLYRPVDGTTITKDKMVNIVSETLLDIKDFNDQLWDKMSKIVEDGASITEVSAGAFAPAMAKLLQNYLKDRKSNSWSEEDVKKLVNEKYKLYQEVYLPKKAKGARYDALSYVLFMPENDLRDYTGKLKELKRSLGETNDVRRESLYNFLITLLEKYSGNKSLTKDANKVSTQDLREIMQGLKKEGAKGSLLSLSLPGQEDFNIGDVKDKRKLSDEQVLSFVRKIIDKANLLDDIIEKGDDYEFSYKSSKNRYYWIPLDATF